MVPIGMVNREATFEDVITIAPNAYGALYRAEKVCCGCGRIIHQGERVILTATWIMHERCYIDGIESMDRMTPEEQKARLEELAEQRRKIGNPAQRAFGVDRDAGIRELNTGVDVVRG